MKDIIFLIEDDPQQSASIKAAIERRYRNAEVELLETESEFCNRIAELPAGGGRRPRIVVSDVMLPWAFPTSNTPEVPTEVVEGTFRKAGLRCWNRFRQREDLRQIPWIYFTVLDEKTIEFEKHSDEQTGYAQKSNQIDPLLDEMEEYFHLDGNWTETDDQVTEKIITSPKMRRILLNGLNTPLSDCVTSLP
jgi:CheY-like chemotaxis protein